ncbi:MAG: hypothetical protein Q8942_16260 [Bacillota bacterium]|nr:hypothetical protein [Bacillota bacterium]
MKKNLLKVFMLFLVLNFLFVGCGDSKFHDKYITFEDYYKKMTIDLDYNDPFNTINSLKEDKNLKVLDNMKKIVSEMRILSSNNSDNITYDYALKRYNALEFLKYAATKSENKLTDDERSRVVTELTIIEANKGSDN